MGSGKVADSGRKTGGLSREAGLRGALVHYCRRPAQARVSPLGLGLINNTYLVEEGGRTLILQEINTQVFREPELIISNLAQLNRHFVDNPMPHLPHMSQDQRWDHCRLLPTLDGHDFFRDDHDRFWRALHHIGHSVCHEQVTTSGQALEVGRALGLFHRLTADLDTGKLQVTLPGFHVLPRYLEDYDRLPLQDQQQDQDQAAIEWCRGVIEAHRSESDLLEQGRRQGIFIVRCVHGDPKAGNVLFDRSSGRAVGLIDLDTVGPGLTIIDLGDCLRSCCSQDTKEGTQTPIFSLERCQALLHGYFQETRNLLGSQEQAAIFDALRLITFELGLRFFSDHLSGNTYFKVEQPGDNLARALSQFRILATIEAQEKEIRALVLLTSRGSYS